jgi:hypothetical protein
MSLFTEMMAEMAQSKNVSNLIVGQAYLTEGSHDVRITAVDTSEIENDKGGTFKITFEDDKGNAHNQFIYLSSVNKRTRKPEVGYGFRLLLSGLFPDMATLVKFAGAAENNPRIVESFNGMRLNITLEIGSGTVAKALPADEGELPKYAGFAADGTQVTPAYATTKEVYDHVKADPVMCGKRAYLQVAGVKATHKAENAAAFDLALSHLAKAADAKKHLSKGSF